MVVETAAGKFVVKLRGAAQGIPPLIAEVVVAELGRVLGLPVPEWVLIDLDVALPSDDRNDELADLLRASVGRNLGFRFLPGAKDLGADEALALDPDFADSVLWLDGLVSNLDRTPTNPNILLWNRQPWLIDHGAALSFHFDWSSVTEDSPREVGFDASAHLFSSRTGRPSETDERNTRALSRKALTQALSEVPDEWLASAFPVDSPDRSRNAYVAYLWKRLRAPRPFWESKD